MSDPAAGLEVYLVGGAVRDQLLNYPYDESDWVVVGSTADDLLKRGFKQVGKDFPVFLHPDTGEEFALARTERKSGHGYAGFQVHASPEVTLEEDLARRDLTINAMAKSASGHIVDPYDGQGDLSKKLLKHVSDNFSKDPLRVLRVARFAARYHHLGLLDCGRDTGFDADAVSFRRARLSGGGASMARDRTRPSRAQPGYLFPGFE